MFSVIIPLYNKAPYLQRALDSVYAQSCPADEIIIVNDGSTDGGDLIAKSQRDPRVRVIDQPNQGVSVARNTGIAAASQPYAAFLDADDEWMPGFLTRIKEMVGRFPEAGLYGTGFMTVAEGSELRRYGVSHRVFQHGDTETREKGIARPAFGPVVFFLEWSRGHVIHTSSMVVPRRVAIEVGGFPAGVTICEDHEFLAKVALAFPFVLSTDVLTRYHVDVPGQAVGYWQKGYKQKFEVLPYHRFLAEEMRRIKGGTTKGTENTKGRETKAEKRWTHLCELCALCGFKGNDSNERSFVMYCRKEFAKCLSQRLYWGRFDAASEFYQTLRLRGVNCGVIVRICGWIANHRSIHPVIGSVMRVVRWIRG